MNLETSALVAEFAFAAREARSMIIYRNVARTDQVAMDKSRKSIEESRIAINLHDDLWFMRP